MKSYRNENGFLHREDGPAVISPGGDKHWFLNGLLHRVDGPAVETANGDKKWYINGHLHREDGPAVENLIGDSSKSRYWFINGRLHREDGPAIEWSDGQVDWYLNGEKMSEEEFKHQIKKNKVKEEGGLDDLDVNILDDLGLFESKLLDFKSFKKKIKK